MHVERLIELVRNYSFLYDQQDKKYSDNNRKIAAWKKIGKILNEEAESCKKQWNNLRDRYRRYLRKKRETKSGQVINKQRKWIYDDEMQFLMPHLKERETIASMQMSSESNDKLDNVDEKDILQNSTSQDCSLQDCIVQHDSLQRPTIQATVCNASKKALQGKQSKSPEGASTVVMDYVSTNRMKNINVEQQSMDDIDLFFKSVALSIKKLSPRNQVIAKARISSIVFDLQLQELSTTNYQYSSPYSYNSSHVSPSIPAPSSSNTQLLNLQEPNIAPTYEYCKGI